MRGITEYMTGASGGDGDGDCDPAGYTLAFLIVAVLVLVYSLIAFSVRSNHEVGVLNLPGMAVRRVRRAFGASVVSADGSSPTT